MGQDRVVKLDQGGYDRRGVIRIEKINMIIAEREKV